MPDISSSLSKREVNARQNTYTKSEIDLKDGAIQAIAEAAQTTADAAEKKNQEQDQLIAELQRSSHSHSNQAVLDKTEQPYTTAERDKLAGLENYTHPNYTAHAKGFYKVANDGKGHVTDAGKVTKKDITDLGIPGEDTNTTYELALPTYASQKEPPAPMLSLNGSDGSENRQTIPCAYTVLDDIVYKEFSGFKIGGKYRSVADLAFVIPRSARIYPWRITANVAIETPSGNTYIDLHYALEITDKGSSIRRYLGNEKYYYGNSCATNDWAILSDLQNFSNPDRDVWLYRIGVPDDVFNKLTNAYCEARLVYQTGKNGDVVKPVSYYKDITFDENVHAMDTNLVYVLTKADVSDVAFTGSYNDLSDKPTIPDVSGKQDKLTAGANITLSGNTISAKDTTYGNASTSAAGLMSAVDKKKLAGIAAGAEVNQNAFSTIATGSARYAATAKQSAFLIDGDGGTSVSLDTKTGRLTVSSHTHDNKGTLDKITDVGWNTVYGNTHSHDNKAVLDKTTASYTAADKKKLDGIAAGATKVAVDSALSATSTNPVQNKAVKAALDSKSASGHTHAMITNSMLLIGGANNAASWVRLGTLVSGGDARSAIIRVWSGNGFNAGAYQNASFEIQIKDGWQSTQSAAKACGVTVYRINCGTVKVKVIPTAHNTYVVWVYLPWGYWNGNYAVYGKYSSWVSQDLRQTAEPEGTGADTDYYDHAFITSTVANATTWNGLINDVDTYNSSDTWVLVKKDNKIQHRYAGELDVNSAKTLVDSGWVTCPLAVTGNTTYPTSASTIRVRKYGKMVKLEGWVKYSTAFNTGHNVATIPAGYRPANVMYIIGATNAGAGTKIVFYATIGAGGNIGFSPADQNSSATFNPAVCYEFHATYFID